MIGTISIFVGFIVVVVLMVRRWNPLMVGLAAATVVIALNRLPYGETMTGVYFEGFCTMFKSLFPVIYSGSLLAQIYNRSDVYKRQIQVTVGKGDSYAKVRIANYHTNIVLIEKDGEVRYFVPVEGEKEEGLTDRSILNVEDIWEFINIVDVEDIREIITRQSNYNTAIANEGLRGDYGANIGSVLLDTYCLLYTSRCV